MLLGKAEESLATPNWGHVSNQGHLRLVGVTDDSKIGSLVPTGFFNINTFRVKVGANSPALGGDTGTWGLGVGLGHNLYEIEIFLQR